MYPTLRYADMHNAGVRIATNPFTFGSLAQDEAFTDRREEIAALAADMRNGQDVVVLAPRRYGKTSLVLRAAQELLADDVLVAYCDLMRTPTKVRLAAALAKTIVDDLLSPVQGLLERAGAVVRGLESARPSSSIRGTAASGSRSRRSGGARTSTPRSSACSSCPPRSPPSANSVSRSCSTSSRRWCGSTTRCRT